MTQTIGTDIKKSINHPQEISPTSTRKKVLIVGGGFAGLNAARTLANADGVDVTILDRHNFHLFQPLLYQVATAGLNPADIASPLRTVLRNARNTRVLMGEAKKIDIGAKNVTTDFGVLDYDYLILACGSQHSYFGHDEWEPFAPGLKTIEQATEIRRRIFSAFELAERETNPERVRQLLTFVIVGGGPTGVELAGTLGEITRFALSRDFRHIDPTKARIILIESGPRLLAMFDEKLSARAHRDLETLGVTIWTGSSVTGINETGVTLKNETVEAATVLWAAGVKPSPLNTQLGAPLDRGGRVIIHPDLSLPNQKDVFVLGDQACFIGENGKPLPGLAPVAMQQGILVAKNILADLRGRERAKFHYRDKGQMATIGRRRAVAETSGLKFTGLIAWFAWLTVHIFYLIGFKNRAIVLFEWVWSYLTYKRGARLITHRDWQFFRRAP